MEKTYKKHTKYQIDQSGKIEDTAKNTIIAYSNGTQNKDKIILQIIKKLLILNSNPSHLISFCRIGRDY